MTNNIVNILKEHIGDWLITYDDNYRRIYCIQKIDEVIERPYNYVKITGAFMQFENIELSIRKYAQDIEYSERDLKYSKFISTEDFENQIGKMINNYLTEI